MAFAAERLQKIDNIMPNFYSFATQGDEVTLGLEGDPMFPASYRGEKRPVGNIVKLQGQAGERSVEIRLKDGTTIVAEEDETSAKKVWEFTDEGYRGVVQRQRANLKQEKEAVRYRGIFGENNALQKEFVDLKEEVETLRKVMFTAVEGLAEDVSNSSADAKFAGALMKEMREYNATYQAIEAKETFDFSDDDDEDDPN
tara:strand:- start:942 stop:1538 length:597 start_codon:yes stop_codon:yes gene_type:complete